MKKDEAPVVIITPTQLLELAINKDLDIDKLEKLVGLQERFMAQEAKKAFLRSVTLFQSKCPVMKKTKRVSFVSKRTGGKTEYYYAPLPEIVSTIKKLLEKLGLSYRWETENKSDGKISITCIVSHVDGHSESNTIESHKDDSGQKNTIQQEGSAVTYLQRYTLIGAFGISTADTDMDGEQRKPPKPKKINQAESDQLLTKAKLNVDGYENRMELKKNSGQAIQEYTYLGMHKPHLQDLQNYFKTKYALLKKTSKQIDLP